MISKINSRQWSAQKESDSPAGRYNGQPRRAYLSANPSCWSSMICPAHWRLRLAALGTYLRVRWNDLSRCIPLPLCPAPSRHIVVLKDGDVESERTLDQLLLTSPEMQELWTQDENGSSPVWLTSTHQAIMMKLPQVGRAIAALHVQGRGKSALHGAQRRITSGVGNAERREPAGTGPQKQTAAR
jgi:hypothetical protein